MTPVLEATGLRKTYGSFVAVANATFTVHPGEIVGFLGPNGAGKTTTIRMITGLLRPDNYGVDAEGVVDSRQDFDRVDRAFDR